MKNALQWTARVLVTLVVVAAAGVAGRYVWKTYMEEPWTRDGRVRAIVLNVAPDVSGLITRMPIQDNQPIRKGDLLFTIDQERFKFALAQAGAAVKIAEETLAQKKREQERRRVLLASDSTTREDYEQAENAALVAEASLHQALAARDTAALDLTRTEIRSTVDGYVSNLQLGVGDYATVGKAVLALVDTNTLYVAGYFEETKLRAIRPGARATVKLMAYPEPLRGHVESIAAAIVDRDNAAGADLVADVNPTFSWVRLAQRIPVRVALDDVPPDIRLTAGMTATVIIDTDRSTSSSAPPPWWRWW